MIDEIVDVGETLPSMEAQRYERHVTRINIEARTAKTPAAVCLAVDTEAMQIHVAPCEHDLQRGMEGGQGHVATDEEATPDQRADPLDNHPELIDMR